MPSAREAAFARLPAWLRCGRRLGPSAAWWGCALLMTSWSVGCVDRVPEPGSRTAGATSVAPTTTSTTSRPVGTTTTWAQLAKPQRAPPDSLGDGLLFEAKTEYSHVKVVDHGRRRILYFVRDNGEEVVESIVDLRKPDWLYVDYTRAMFVSYLFLPRHERCLLVGLGGGSMVRFLNRYFPETAVEVVEIDPVVVKIARQYFSVRSGPNVNVMVEDGFVHLRRPGPPYDVIYMDAFLKPSDATDAEGAPLRLKTVEFLRQLQARLTPKGLFVVNLNQHEQTPSDIAALEEAFGRVYLFPVPNTGNTIAVGTVSPTPVSRRTLRDNGMALDRRANHGFSFTGLSALQREP